jgi:hypothetical protein
MSANATNTTAKDRKRHNISMSEDTRKRAEELAELEKRSVSNLLEVLVDKEWERLKQQEKAVAA